MTVCSASASPRSKEFRVDVEKGAFPEDKHLVPIADAQFATFMKGLEK
jgi:hypothetical protein